MPPPNAFFRKQFFLDDGSHVGDTYASYVPRDDACVETHVAGQSVIFYGEAYRVIHTQFSVEEGELIVLRREAPPGLIGYLCEVCLDAPGIQFKAAPWGGDMAVCDACA